MEVNKELKIIPPAGMEYYIENDTVKFRPIEKKLDIEDVYKELFQNKQAWRLHDTGINECSINATWYFFTNCTSKKQAEKLIAYNKLMNVAKYLNDGWVPDWNNFKEPKYHFYIDKNKDIRINNCSYINYLDIYFKSEELAKQALEMLEEETIRLVLSTDY